MHSARVQVDSYVIFHGYGCGVGAPLVACGIFGIDETSDWEPESVGHAGRDAVVVSEGSRTEPLELFGF